MLHCRVNSEKLHPSPHMKSRLPYIFFGFTFIVSGLLSLHCKLKSELRKEDLLNSKIITRIVNAVTEEPLEMIQEEIASPV